MSCHEKEVVSALCAALVEQIGQPRYERWFADQTRLQLSGDRLLVAVSNQFYETWLERNFRVHVEAAAQRVLGRVVRAEFDVDDTLGEAADARDAAFAADDLAADRQPPPSKVLPQSIEPQSSDPPVAGAVAAAPAVVAPDPPAAGPRPQRGEPHKPQPAATAAETGIRRASASAGGGAGSQVPRTAQQAGSRDEAATPEDGQAALLPMSVGAMGPASGSGNGRSRGRRFLKLEQFVVGQSNRMAFEAAEMVCREPGRYSPLFVHGPTGVGKTHLLEGIWSRVRDAHRHLRCVFLSAEQFTSYFLAALRGRGVPSFRRKYQDVDLLVIDDVQFFAGKRATMVEVLYTVNSMLESGRQLVLAADRPPSELHALGTDLAARLNSGLVCALKMPDVDVRRRLLEQMAERMGESFTPEVYDLVAERMPTHAWELSGAVNRLIATRQALGRPLSAATAREALADLFQMQHRTVRLADVEQAVCEVLGVEPKQLQADARARRYSHPRMLAMWLARKHTRAGLSEIGEYFGRRSHATVIAAQKKVAAWLADGTPRRLADRDWDVAEAVRRVEERLMTG